MKWGIVGGLVVVALMGAPQITWAQSVEDLLNLSTEAGRAGRFEKAESFSRQVIEIDPNSATAHNNLGGALDGQGKLDEAIEAYNSAIRLDPNYAIAYSNLGNALRDQGKLEEAIEAYNSAIRLDPNFAPAYYNLGIALKDQGKLEEAIEAYNTAIRLDPNDAVAYNNLGVALRDQGKLEKAIEAYNTAIRLDPNYATAYNNLGLVLYDQGKLVEGIENCSKALELPEEEDTTPTSAHTFAHNCLGTIFKEQGEYQQAISEFEQAIDQDPDWPTPRNNLAETQRLLAALQATKIPNDTDWLPQNEPLLPILRSVVRVIAEIPEGSSRGTGWIIKRQDNTAWIVTNHHVLTGDRGGSYNESVEIDFFSEPPPDQVHLRLPARVIQTDPSRDLALIEVTDLPEDIQPLEISTDPPSRQTDILIIGHPINGLPWTAERGLISNRNSERLQISQATLASGNSGGPVLDLETNQVVGIVISVDFCERVESCTSGFAHALPIAYIQNQLRTWDMSQP